MQTINIQKKMKKNSIIACAVAIMLSGCGFTGGTATNNGADLGSVLGGIIGAVTQGDAAANILYDVIGATTLERRRHRYLELSWTRCGLYIRESSGQGWW